MQLMIEHCSLVFWEKVVSSLATKMSTRWELRLYQEASILFLHGARARSYFLMMTDLPLLMITDFPLPEQTTSSGRFRTTLCLFETKTMPFAV
jgi:hypothetical protein